MKKLVLISTILLLTLIFSWNTADAVNPGGADDVQTPTLSSTKYKVGSGESFTLSFSTSSEIPGKTTYTLCPTDADAEKCLNIATLCPADGSQCKKQVITDKYSYTILPIASFAKDVFYYVVKATVEGKDSAYSKPVKIEYNPTSKITLKSSDNFPVSNNKYTLSWTCSNCDVDFYVLYKNKNSSFSGAEEKEISCYNQIGDPINCTSFTDRIYEQTSYYYKIKALDFNVNSVESNVITLTIRQPWFDAPQDSEVFANVIFNMAWLNLSQSVTDVKNYEVCSSQIKDECTRVANCTYNNTCQKTKLSSDRTSFQDAPLKEKPIFSQDKIYYYSFRVFYNDGNFSVWSKEKKVTIKSLRPKIETDKTSINSGETYLIKWPDVDKAEYYYICVSNSPAGSCDVDWFSTRRDYFSTTQDGKRSYQPPPQKPFLTKDYYHRVQAIGQNPFEEISPWSNEVAVKVWAKNPGLTPDHPLYNLSEIMKRVRLFFTFGAENKAEQAMAYAQEKLAETQMMVMKNNTKAINKSVEGYAGYLNLAIDKIGEVKNETKKNELLTKASQDVYEQQFGLNQLLEQTTDECKESVTNALNGSKKALEKSLKIIPEKEKEIQTELNKIKLKFEPPILEKSSGVPKIEELEPLTPLGIPESPKTEKETKEIFEPESEPEPDSEPEPEPESDGPVCGNGTCESGENCANCLGDCACGTGKVCQNGNCIAAECSLNADCNDNNSCTVDTCHNAGASNASCSHTAISSCINNDGCCPFGCNSTNDNNCQPVCGNGICESGENYGNCSQDCEPEIACYVDADCGDGQSCTIHFCENTGTADAYCYFYATITDCYDDEWGCCPAGCTLANDPDCP